MNKENDEKKTLIELKEIAKELNIKNISKLKKSELIEEILNISPKSIEKNGVILQEKITPKNKNEDNSTPTNDNKEEVREEKRERLKVMINESDTAIGVLEILENNSFGFLRVISTGWAFFALPIFPPMAQTPGLISTSIEGRHKP